MSRYQRIYNALSETLKPVSLLVEDESSKHHVPKGAETHFKISIVSDAFNELSRLERHRFVNTLLAGELQAGLHAISMHLYSPKEWTRVIDTTQSPACRGGKHRDK